MYVRPRNYKDSVELEVSASSRVACSYTKVLSCRKITLLLQRWLLKNFGHFIQVIPDFSRVSPRRFVLKARRGWERGKLSGQ